MTEDTVGTRTLMVDFALLTVLVTQHGIPDYYCRAWLREDQLRGVATTKVTAVQE